MRIGMILDAPFPPDARVENEARALMESGFEVHLLHIDFARYQHYRSAAPATAWQDRNDPDGAAFDGFTCTEHSGIHIWQTTGSLFAYKASAVSATMPFYRWWAEPRIRRFLNKSKVDLFHVHDMVVAEAVLNVARNVGLPVVLDLHEDRPEIMKSYRHVNTFPGRLLIPLKAWRRKQRKLMQRADHVLLVTEEARKVVFDRDGIAPDKTSALPNVVWPEVLGQNHVDSALEARGKGRFTLLYIGDTSLRRGTLTALEAVRILEGRIPELQLILVGSSSQDHLLQAYVHEHGLKGRVHFEGWQPANRLFSYVHAADLCLSPLLRNPHHDTTYANKLFQYMAVGRAVIVSDCPAQTTVVREAGCGLVHTAGDPVSLANAVEKLWCDVDKREEMGRRGVAAVKERWNWQVAAPALIECYKRLLPASNRLDDVPARGEES